jgi:hypothetical protein
MAGGVAEWPGTNKLVVAVMAAEEKGSYGQRDKKIWRGGGELV